MKRLLPFIAVLVVCGPFCQQSPAENKPEPRYEGKTLKDWVERLRRADSDNDRYHAREVLISFGPDAVAAVPELVEMLDDRSEGFRGDVGAILNRLGPVAKSAVPDLVRSLKEKTARDPHVIIYILGGIGPDAKEAVPVLRNFLADYEKTAETMTALRQIGPLDKEMIPAILQGIQHARSHGKTIGLEGAWVEPLAKLGEDSVPLLLEFLGQDDQYTKQKSAQALGMIGPSAKKASLALTSELEHGSGARLAAARALWLIEKNPKVFPVLSELLGRGDYEAATILGEIGPPAKVALPALEKALSYSNVDRYPRNDDSAVRCAAARAIWLIDKNPKVIPILSALLQEDVWTTGSAAETLGEIGPLAKPTIPALQKSRFRFDWLAQGRDNRSHPQNRSGSRSETSETLTALVYHFRNTKERDGLRDDLVRSIQTPATRKEVSKMGQTIAEALREEGKLEGEIEGEIIGELNGKRKALILLLQRKFGRKAVSAVEASIAGTRDSHKLDEWLGNFTNANTLKDVGIPVKK